MRLRSGRSLPATAYALAASRHMPQIRDDARAIGGSRRGGAGMGIAQPGGLGNCDVSHHALSLRFRALHDHAALIGYRAMSFTAAEKSESWRKRLSIAAASLCVLGILGSHYVLLIHKVWSIAVPMPVRLALLPFAPFARAGFEP